MSEKGRQIREQNDRQNYRLLTTINIYIIYDTSHNVY